MLKILMYCDAFFPENSGYSNAYKNLINTVLDNDEKVNITVVTPKPLGNHFEWQRDRLTIVRLTKRIKLRKISYIINDWLNAKFVSKKFNKENYDLLWVETFDRVFFLSGLDKNIIDKTAVRIHSTSDTEYAIFSEELLFRINKFFMKFVAKKIKWVLSTNSYHLDFYKKHFLNDNLIVQGNKNFLTLPNPVPLNPPVKLSVGNKIKVILLGRMATLGSNQKGFMDFFYALQIISKQTINKFEITIVGKGDLRQYFIDLCSDIENVKFIESLPHEEIINYLQESDVVVLPSRYEGLSMFALEGLSTGNICLFSDTGGLKDMINNNGYAFPPQNIEQLVSSIERLSEHNKHDLEVMKKNSLMLCEEKFSPEIVAKKFMKIVNLISKN